MTCARCGFATTTSWDRCPSCAAPAGSALRGAVDCLAKPDPRLPDGERGEPVGLLGSVVVGLLGAAALLTLVSAAAGLKSAQAISRGDLDASTVSALRDTVTVLSGLAALAGIVMWFIWLVRVVRNSAAFGLVAPRYRGAWVVGNWFIPVLNLWRPKRTLEDAWRGSGGPRTALIGWWWGLYVCSVYPLPLLVGLAVGSSPSSRGDYQLYAFADLVNALVWAGAAYLADRLTRLQEPVLHAAAPATDEPAVPAVAGELVAV